jgi:signal transduction histidine kinase
MVFRRALIRLTLTYSVWQLLLFGAFAIGIYAFVTGAFDFDAPALEASVLVDAETNFATLRTGLIVGYAILVALIPASSYLMARSALSPVRRSYLLQQRFVDDASHELRSPLSVIQGELELALARSRTPAQYRAAIETSLEAAEGLTRLTNDLLLLSRENADELEATFRPVSLNEIARRAGGATGRKVTVNEARSILVNGSSELLVRALSNLVDNAVKFTDASGSITISVSGNGRSALLAVTDDGAGMTEMEAARAFDRFWRASEARTVPGFGLGLPLVQQIAAAHHGKATISSSPGLGTTVTVMLPEWQP